MKRTWSVYVALILLSGVLVAAPRTLAQGPPDPTQIMPEPVPPPAASAPSSAPNNAASNDPNAANGPNAAPPASGDAASAPPASGAPANAPNNTPDGTSAPPVADQNAQAAPTAASSASPPPAPPASSARTSAPNSVPVLAPVPPVDPLASLLAPEMKIFGYSIRPPKDYTYAVLTQQAGAVTVFTWRGSLHPDGSVTSFALQFLHSTPSPIIKDPRDPVLRELLKGMQDIMTNFVTAPVENGSVGGFPALRTTLTGVIHRRTGGSVVTQGFAYVIQDGQITVAMIGLDELGSFTANFPALNAAAMSFHKPAK